MIRTCLGLSFVAGLLIGGCGESPAPKGTGGTTSGTGNQTNPPAGATASAVLGSWVVDPAQYAAYAQIFVVRMLTEQGQPITDAVVTEGVSEVTENVIAEPPVFTFSENGVFALRVGTDNGRDGTWALDGDVVRITATDGLPPIGDFRLRDGKLVTVKQAPQEMEATLIRQP